jgi:hypothetical protein
MIQEKRIGFLAFMDWVQFRIELGPFFLLGFLAEKESHKKTPTNGRGRIMLRGKLNFLSAAVSVAAVVAAAIVVAATIVV